MSIASRQSSIPFPKIRRAPPGPQDETRKIRFQDLLVERGQLSPGDLFRAIALQHRENGTLGDLLQGLGMASEATVLDAMAASTGLPLVDLARQPPIGTPLAGLDPSLMIRWRFLPWRRSGDRLLIAISDPDHRPGILDLLADRGEDVDFVLARGPQIIDWVARHHGADLSRLANSRTPAGESCRDWLAGRLQMFGLIAIVALIGLAILYPQTALRGAFGVIALALCVNGFFKVATLIAALRAPSPAARPGSLRPERLPRISVLVPVLRENDILDRLIDRMSRLNYPRELLEILLVHEETDTETRAHLAQRSLPPWLRTVCVPADRLQTKPRALNYALDFCRGDIIGIYDAEDAPEPDQLFQVVRRFASAGASTACVQCALDYYNAQTNWISRCFTIEYAILFRVILPGLERLGLPIPLGGTSVFFRRDILEKLGRWDAQNVTEDADLGIRLHRHGYRCVMADSTTFEEANFRILPWVKQRSRWLKGFVLTWMTHMRRPVGLFRDLGAFGFVIFQAQMLGTVISFASAPLVLPMWLMTLGLAPALYDALPAAILPFLIGGFVGTELLLLFLGMTATGRRPSGRLGRWVLTMPLYWPIGALAAAKALLELVTVPAYWDKTAHGINDAACQSEIERLTALSARVKRAPVPDPSGTGG